MLYFFESCSTKATLPVLRVLLSIALRRAYTSIIRCVHAMSDHNKKKEVSTMKEGVVTEVRSNKVRHQLLWLFISADVERYQPRKHPGS